MLSLEPSLVCPDRVDQVTAGETVHENHDGKGSKYRATSTEYNFAGFVVSMIAVVTQLSASVTIDDDNKVEQANDTHHDTVKEQISQIGA